jgi:hypothetical protein
MDNIKKYSILSLVSIVIVSFYFYQNDEKKEIIVKTDIQKSETINVIEVDNKKQQKKQIVHKKIEKKVVNPIIYKNDETNNDYIMELKVPEKWSKLDYSHYGNPPEVALSQEEYLPGDELYTPDDENFWKDGQYYLTAEVEKTFVELYQNRKTIKLILNEVDFPDSKTFNWKDTDLEGYFSDINRAIYIDEETGRKVIKANIIFDTSRLLFSLDVGYYEKDIEEEENKGWSNKAKDIYSEKEYIEIKKFYSTYQSKFNYNLNTGYNVTLASYGNIQSYEDSALFVLPEVKRTFLLNYKQISNLLI